MLTLSKHRHIAVNSGIAVLSDIQSLWKNKIIHEQNKPVSHVAERWNRQSFWNNHRQKMRRFKMELSSFVCFLSMTLWRCVILVYYWIRALDGDKPKVFFFPSILNSWTCIHSQVIYKKSSSLAHLVLTCKRRPYTFQYLTSNASLFTLHTYILVL